MLIFSTCLGEVGLCGLDSQTRGVILSFPMPQPAGRPDLPWGAVSFCLSLSLLFSPGCGGAPADPESGEEGSNRWAQPSE